LLRLSSPCVLFETVCRVLETFCCNCAQGDDLTVADLVEESLQLSAVDFERIQQIALAEPMLINRLI